MQTETEVHIIKQSPAADIRWTLQFLGNGLETATHVRARPCARPELAWYGQLDGPHFFVRTKTLAKSS